MKAGIITSANPAIKPIGLIEQLPCFG